MGIKRWIYVSAAASIVLLLIGLASNGLSMLREKYNQLMLDKPRAIAFSDVFVHHGDFKKNVPFRAGDFMFAHYKIERFRTCWVTLQFRLTMVREGDRFTGIFSHGYPMVMYYGPPGSLETNEHFEIPRGMPPGHYELRRLNMIECETDKWAEIAPPAKMEIIP